MLAATRYPGSGSFCKEMSNDPVWLQVTEEKWSAGPTFEAYSQGRSIQDVIEDFQGSAFKKAKRSDAIRTELRGKLNKLLGV